MANLNVAKHVFGKVEDQYSTGECFADLFAEASKTEKKEGAVVKGEVIALENDVVVVDIGLKTEGRIPLKEFALPGEPANVRVGDEVEVYLEKIESRNGKTILSREKALREDYWNQLEEALEKKTPADGIIFGKVKGGFTVDLAGGIVAFLPGSQVDVRPIKDIGPLMGITQPFIILKMDRAQGNIVVSRRAILEESRVEARNELLAQITEGQILEGVVKNITDYGAFIDLGSIDGLLHVTDISWSRISHPSEVLTLGQQINVQVIKYNAETKRISLGMKQLETNPWSGIEERYPKGSKFNGKVTNITDYGAFVELESGIEGLVHVSEISWTKTNIHPKKLLTPGQEVEVVILDIESAKHRISLGMKQCNDNPWEEFARGNPVGSIIEGEVRNVVEFGIFIGFDNNIDGLVHISDLTWEDNPEIIKDYKKGDLVKVVILGVDPSKERISLGIKQLTSEPVQDANNELKKNDIVTCTVSAVSEDGIEVTLSEGVTGFIKKVDLSSDRAEQRADRFAVDDRLDAKITTIDKSGKKIGLSIKALEVDAQKKAIAEFGASDSGASLGDILGAALNKAEEKRNSQ